MQIYPAIDLHHGRVVRLYKGDYNQVTDYSGDPLSLAADYTQQGAACIHVVDLDGARAGDFSNLSVIEKMAGQIDIPVQSGGGIRNRDDLLRLFDAGVGRAVIGSLAVKQPQLVVEWLTEFGSEKICLAMDVKAQENAQENAQKKGEAERDFMLATAGWTETANQTLWQGLGQFSDSALQHVLCTDIARDGTLEGPNVALYQDCVARLPKLDFQASGGVKELADVERLAVSNVAGVIIGKAILDGLFTVEEALACSRGA